MAGINALDEIMGEKCELEMTPMIDVTFLLLIFFMCTLKFKVLEGKLGPYLPKDVGVNPQDAHYSPEEIGAGIAEARRFHRTTASHAQGTQGILNATRGGITSIEHGIYLDEVCITEMIERGWVQAVVSTGALMTHGLVELAAVIGAGRPSVNSGSSSAISGNSTGDTTPIFS